MSSYVNPFRKMLAEQKNLIGTNIEMREAVATEILSNIYEFIWVDWEHTWMDRSELMDHLIAARAGGAPVMVRVPGHDPDIVKYVLDMGTDGIVFPMVNTAEEARAAVAACIYPPGGIRGFYPIRATNYFATPVPQYVAENESRIFKVIQLESKISIDNLDEILEVKGIDCVCLGRADLSGSIGKMGDTSCEEVVDLCRKACEIALRHDTVVMCNVGFNPNDILFWKQLGVRVFAVDSDIGMIISSANHQYSQLYGILN